MTNAPEASPIAEPHRQLTAEEVVAQQFFTAQTGRKATAADLNLVGAIHEKVTALALLIEIDVPGGRNKALAKTALEEVQMRAIRAIFAP